MHYQFLREYGVGITFTIPIHKATLSDFATGSDWTPATGDVKIIQNGGTPANIGTLPTAVGSAWTFTLSAAELQCAQLTILIVDSPAKAVEDTCITVDTYGDASAAQLFNFAHPNFSATELAQLRYREGIDGTQSAPSGTTTHLDHLAAMTLRPQLIAAQVTPLAVDMSVSGWTMGASSYIDVYVVDANWSNTVGPTTSSGTKIGRFQNGAWTDDVGFGAALKGDGFRLLISNQDGVQAGPITVYLTYDGGVFPIPLPGGLDAGTSVLRPGFFSHLTAPAGAPPRASGGFWHSRELGVINGVELPNAVLQLKALHLVANDNTVPLLVSNEGSGFAAHIYADGGTGLQVEGASGDGIKAVGFNSGIVASGNNAHGIDAEGTVDGIYAYGDSDAGLKAEGNLYGAFLSAATGLAIQGTTAHAIEAIGSQYGAYIEGGNGPALGLLQASGEATPAVSIDTVDGNGIQINATNGGSGDVSAIELAASGPAGMSIRTVNAQGGFDQLNELVKSMATTTLMSLRNMDPAQATSVTFTGTIPAGELMEIWVHELTTDASFQNGRPDTTASQRLGYLDENGLFLVDGAFPGGSFDTISVRYTNASDPSGWTAGHFRFSYRETNGAEHVLEYDLPACVTYFHLLGNGGLSSWAYDLTTPSDLPPNGWSKPEKSQLRLILGLDGDREAPTQDGTLQELAKDLLAANFIGLRDPQNIAVTFNGTIQTGDRILVYGTNFSVDSVSGQISADWNNEVMIGAIDDANVWSVDAGYGPGNYFSFIRLQWEDNGSGTCPSKGRFTFSYTEEGQNGSYREIVFDLPALASYVYLGKSGEALGWPDRITSPMDRPFPRKDIPIGATIGGTAPAGKLETVTWLSGSVWTYNYSGDDFSHITEA